MWRAREVREEKGEVEVLVEDKHHEESTRSVRSAAEYPSDPEWKV